MKAIELRAFGEPLVLTERPVPVVEAGQEIIDVTACGVCHSDIHVVDGAWGSPLPLILGHEVTGVHKQLGPVMVYAPWGCRQCWLCDEGHEMMCPDGAEAGLFKDGGYAEQMRVTHREYLHPIGDLDPVHSAPLACGGLTAFRAVKHTLDIARRKGAKSRVLVIGAGGLGQFGIQFFRLRTDAEIWVLDPAAGKQQRALELGADRAVSAVDLDGKFDAIIDFVGAPETVPLTVERVHRRGIVVVCGLYGGRVPFGIGAVPHEAQFMSSIWGSIPEMGELIAFAQQHPLQYTVEAMALEDAELAHQRLRTGDVAGRIALVPTR
jgi:alcohol dehydrogenase, propanol-preferring